MAVAQDGIFSLPLRQLLYQDEEEQVEINHRKEISNLSNQKYLKIMHNNPVSQQAQDEIN